MSWKPVIVGVDASPAAAGAAAFGYRLATAAGTECQLVHATRDAWTLMAVPEAPQAVAMFDAALKEQGRRTVSDALRSTVPAAALASLDVRSGPPTEVLERAAEERDASVIVLGGKAHSALGRWLGGSTSLNVTRTAAVPVLTTVGAPTALRRVLVAVDLSPAAGPTLAAARTYADVFGAQLRAVCVIEPLPVIPDVPLTIAPEEYYKLSETRLQRDVWSQLGPRVERAARYGLPVETLLREATDWKADLLVVGSHGKGWAERVLMGSVTEKLLGHLPTSVLVVPVAKAARRVRAAEPLLATATA
jgi:nucleotide-binding universal stress UspA family protein